MKIGFVVHPGRPGALEAAERIVGWARAHGHETRAAEDASIGADESAADEVFPKDLDLIVSVGGDGTLLRAALVGERAGAPVLGVKVGRLGFLTAVDPDDAPAMLEAWLRGDGIEEEERMSLVAEAEGAPWSGPQWGLNEVIVEKRARHRVVRLAAWVDGDYVMTFSADGLIVATPTGSTAYSFAAGGPIVSPRLPCLVLTPVAAHMVFDRPIVLAAEESVTLEVKEEEPAFLSADGRRGLELPVGSRVTIRRSDRPARLLRRADADSFYTLLRRKFALPADPTEVP